MRSTKHALVPALIALAAWCGVVRGQGLLDVPAGVDAPRPIAADPPAPFHDPFASPGTDERSHVERAALWQTFTTPTLGVAPLPAPPPRAEPAAEAGAGDVPLRLDARAADDLAAAGQCAPEQ